MRDDNSGFDPAQDVRLDTVGLRALAHPLRVRMLGRLRLHGPATPSQLARDLGESSGATSYHLRQLLAHGFVVEEPDKGTKRERWYRSAHRTTYFDMKLDDESRELGGEYLRAVARNYSDRMLRFSDAVETVDETFGPEWSDVWTLSDWHLDLDADTARQLHDDLFGLLTRYRDRQNATAAGQQVIVQVQLFPLGAPQDA